VSLPTTTINQVGGVTPSATAQAVTVSQTASMFVGEQLLVDAGGNEELVTLTGVGASSMTGVFANAHANGATITVLGVFPSGIVPTSGNDVYPTSGSLPNTPSSGNVLNLFGDINGDGSLVYVRYSCNSGNGAVGTASPGTLTRSVTTITPGSNTLSSSQTLLSTLVSTPTCFQYLTQPYNTNYYVTNIGFTVTVQSRAADPQTRQFMTMTKSFLNLSPRNVLAAMELANAGVITRLQATPANVSSY
jgi:hypothetical protein